MSDQEVQSAVKEVIRAIDRLNRVFDEQARLLREAGDKEKLREWLKGCLALRDSGDMYISWARHYAKGADGGNSAEEDDVLDEEGPWEGPPHEKNP